MLRKSLFTVLTLVAMTACATPSAPAPNVPLLDVPDGWGSGIVVSPGWVLTAAHIGEEIVGADRFVPHDDEDLMLVHMPELKGSAILALPPAFDSKLTAMGWHDGSYLVRTAGFQGNEPGLMSCPVIPGCSGGPVLDEQGRVIGIVRSVYMYAAFDSRNRQRTPWVSPMAHISWYTPLSAEVQSWIRSTIHP